MNRKIKLYIIWVYFLIYPLTNAYLPDIDMGVVRFNPHRLFLILPVLYLFHLFVINRGRIKFSKEVSFLFFYTLFAIFNSWRTGNFAMPSLINFFFPVFLILVIENLEFREDDFVMFYRMLAILAAAVFVVSLIQVFMDHSFYIGTRRLSRISRYTFGHSGHFRHVSLFRSIDFYQGGLAIGMLCLIFMFENFKKIKLKYLALCFMMLISTFFTYTRSNWLIPLIGIMLFIHYKPWNKKIVIIFIVFLLSLILYIQFFSQLQQSVVYRERVTEGTYEGRFISIEIYFKHFWGKNMLMGHGIDSRTANAFRPYGRSEAHNGYLEILFRGGFIGFFLYFAFWYYLYRRGKLVLKKTGNGVFVAFILVFLASNFVFKFVHMNHYGYHLMIFYLHMCYQVYVKKEVKEPKNQGLGKTLEHRKAPEASRRKEGPRAAWLTIRNGNNKKN
ncbi:MAG: O-antigen ligase family protein [bacterium]|nr:O-antigen ligase family protein [bacterium]